MNLSDRQPATADLVGTFTSSRDSLSVSTFDPGANEATFTRTRERARTAFDTSNGPNGWCLAAEHRFPNSATLLNAQQPSMFRLRNGAQNTANTAPEGAWPAGETR